MNEKIFTLIDRYGKEARAIRKYLHEYPEVSTQEKKTSIFLKKQVRRLGLPIEEVPNHGTSRGHGFIATLDTGKPGKTIGLRTDIDALPIKENVRNLSGTRPFISKNEGAMHACGHDGHMAILLTAMKILVDLKEHLKGKIIFIFEEGEEVSSGIKETVKLLKGKNIDAIYGNHLVSFLDTGKIAVESGPIMTAISVVDFKIRGRGGHGSRPDKSINPLFVGVDVLNSISVAWNNQINLEKTVTLGLTQFHVGDAYNVFADEAQIGGSLRYFDVREGERAYNILHGVARNVAKAHNSTIEISPHAGHISIPVINDKELALQAQMSVLELFPEALEHDIKWYASESFSLYSEIAPCVFSFVGMRNEALGSGAEHHNEYFDVDDDALKYGIGLMTKFTVDFLLDNKNRTH